MNWCGVLSVLIGLSGLRLRFYEKWPPDVANVTFIFKPSVQSHQTLCVIYDLQGAYSIIDISI